MLSELLLAAFITSAGLHPWGHVAKGYQHDAPMTIHYSAFYEVVTPERELAQWEWTEIDGAGFELQSRVSRAVGRPSVSITTAGYFLKYVLSRKELRADVENMEQQSGNHHIREIVAGVAIAELIQAKTGGNWHVGFTTFGSGTPGAVINIKF